MTGGRGRERIVTCEQRPDELCETCGLPRARRPGRTGAIRGNEDFSHGLRGGAGIHRARLGHLVKVGQQRGPNVVTVLRLSVAKRLRGEERIRLGQLVVMPREPFLRHERGVVVVVEETSRSRFAVPRRNRSNQGAHRVAHVRARLTNKSTVVNLRGDEHPGDDIRTRHAVGIVKLTVEP